MRLDARAAARTEPTRGPHRPAPGVDEVDHDGVAVFAGGHGLDGVDAAKLPPTSVEESRERCAGENLVALARGVHLAAASRLRTLVGDEVGLRVHVPTVAPFTARGFFVVAGFTAATGAAAVAATPSVGAH